MSEEMTLYDHIEALNPNVESYILTVLDQPETGEKALVSGGSVLYRSHTQGFFGSHAEAASAVRESGILSIGGRRIYSELLGHDKKIVLCGAGHVSIAIIRMAKLIGCRVIVVEDRPMFCDKAEEAGADQVICDSFEKGLEQIPGDPDTYFVIVTRGHRYDTDCLRIIARKPCAYIGMMGSRRRVKIVREQLAAEGLDRELLESIHAPIGLSIEAETPEEIAVSVLGEIIAVKNGARRNFGYPDDILDAVLEEDEICRKGRRVLATIITRKGSAPRQVGTKMLFRPDGRNVGTIGGGCIEAEVETCAREMLASGEPRAMLHHVDLTDDAAAEDGAVCGGILDVLLEMV